MAGHYISAGDWPDFAALLRAWRSGELKRPRGPAAGERAGFGRAQLVVLYGELDSGGTAQAEILRRESQLEVQDVSVLGWPANALLGTTITLRWQGEDLPPFPLTGTRAQVWERLRDSPLRKLLLDVTLGSREDVPGDIHPGRWRLSLAPQPDGAPWPLLTVADHQLGSLATVVVQRMPFVGTGRLIEVHSVLPTGDQLAHVTPLRRGAQCAAVHFGGVGWGIVAAEMRKFPAGNFGEFLPEAPL